MTLGSSDSDSFTYDSATNRMTKFQATVNSQSLTGTIGRNAVGTPASLSIVDAFNASDTQNCTYGHDDLVRIVAVNCGTIWGQTFAFDPFGNVDKAVISGDSGISYQANYSSTTNRISTVAGFSPGYDSNGNLTSDSAHTYTWNSEARPVAIDSVTLTYDALNRIVEQSNGGVFTQTVYSPLGIKFALMNGQTLSKAFAPLPDGGIAAYTSSGLTYYRHPDWLGSSRLASTPTRTIYADVAYAPFGESYAPSGSTDLSFTGQNQDTASGLYDFLFREQSSIQGRWISPDPSGLSAVNLADPQSLNRYVYARNSPLLLVDPLGLNPCTIDFVFLGYESDQAIIGIDINCTGSPTGPGGLGGSGAGGAQGGPGGKSPARQKCEADAQAKFTQSNTAAMHSAVKGGLIGGGVVVALQLAAGCALGTGAGTFAGGLGTFFLGGAGAFAGAPIGCLVGAAGAVAEGAPLTVVSTLATGGIILGLDKSANQDALNRDLLACSQIP